MDNDNDEWDIDSLGDAVASLITAVHTHSVILAGVLHALSILGVTMSEHPDESTKH